MSELLEATQCVLGHPPGPCDNQSPGSSGHAGRSWWRPHVRVRVQRLVVYCTYPCPLQRCADYTPLNSTICNEMRDHE